jgi:hypothetical protein
LKDHGVGTAPKHNSSTIYGPELPLAVLGNPAAASVYQKLGAKVLDVLRGQVPGWEQIPPMNNPQDF